MTPTLLVLAAGMGSRYGGLKQVDPVGPSGEAILDYSIFDAQRAGFGRVVFVIRRVIEAPFRAAVAGRFAERLPVEYVFQELEMIPALFSVPAERQKPWGTGHAVLVANHSIREPFAVITADDFYGRNSFQILADRLTSAPVSAKADYAMVGFALRQTLSEYGAVSRGVCQCDDNGWLLEVREIVRLERENSGARYREEDGTTRRLSGEETVSMSMWGFTPSIFDHLREQFAGFLRERGGDPRAEFYIPTVVNELLAAGQARVKVLRTPDPWFGITYPQDKPAVARRIRELVDRGEYPERLWS